MADLARGIWSHAGRTAVAHQHFLDVVGGNTGPRQRRPSGDGAKLGGVNVLEGAAELANGSPRCAQNHHLTGRLTCGGHEKKMISNERSKNPCNYRPKRKTDEVPGPNTVQFVPTFCRFAPHFAPTVEYDSMFPISGNR
jgi:hypothetical protein